MKKYPYSTTKKMLKHERIAARLREMIKDRFIATGGLLPTELELGEMFRCSRGTVRRALDTLASEGLVRRKQGSGSYVRRIGRLGSQGFIGLITPGLLNTEVLRFFHEFTLQAATLGYHILLEVNVGMPTIEHDFVEELARRQVAGVVKFPTILEDPNFEIGIRDALRKHDLPHVIINDFWGDPSDSNHLLLDEAAAVETAVDHLYSLGHRRIAWADTPELKAMRQNGLSFFREALERRGLHLPQEYILGCYSYVPMAINEIWPETGEPPTAIVTPYDGIVRRFIEAFPKIGLHIPNDISIVDLNGQAVLSTNTNEFTCASSPVEDMVSKALDLILNSKAEGPVCRYLYPPKFLVGLTSGPPPANHS